MNRKFRRSPPRRRCKCRKLNLIFRPAGKALAKHFEAYCLVWPRSGLRCDLTRPRPPFRGRHAEIVFDGADFVVKDNKSFNGTLINGQRISATTPLYHDDQIQLGLGGPIIIFNSPGRIAGRFKPRWSTFNPRFAMTLFRQRQIRRKPWLLTLVGLHRGRLRRSQMSHTFDDRSVWQQVRANDRSDESNNIRVDGLQISTPCKVAAFRRRSFYRGL
jgi:hypothetical protein